MTEWLEARLNKRKSLGNFRERSLASPPIDFSSNDYLGLARSSILLQDVQTEWKAFHTPFNGLGSTGSRLLTGNSSYAHALEADLAAFHGYETGLLFNCGYMANVGLLSAVATPDTVVLFDTAVHASVHDGIRLSRARAFPFRHNDVSHLEHRLKSCHSLTPPLICIESLYSTDGSIAPLAEICDLARRYHAYLIVDEAHAVGCWGPRGAGLVAAAHLTSQVFAQVTTFGKAVGTQGAVVLGNRVLQETLINFSTAYIYTTALPFHMLAAIRCSYALFPKMDEAREKLHQLVSLFSQLYPTTSLSHIQSIPIRGNRAAKALSHALAQRGFDARPLLSPTVRRGEERLRLCLHAFNTVEEMRALLHAIEELRHDLV